MTSCSQHIVVGLSICSMIEHLFFYSLFILSYNTREGKGGLNFTGKFYYKTC